LPLKSPPPKSYNTAMKLGTLFNRKGDLAGKIVQITTDLPGLINNVSPFVIIVIAHFEVLSLCLLHFLSMVKFQGVLLALH
jgi:hypothetical protein